MQGLKDGKPLGLIRKEREVMYVLSSSQRDADYGEDDDVNDGEDEEGGLEVDSSVHGRRLVLTLVWFDGWWGEGS